MSETKDRWVLILDKHRGIAFGRLIEHDRILQAATLADARHVYAFTTHASDPGVWGLATGGPASGSSVTNPVARAEINDVSKVLDASEEAIANFRKIKWRKK